MLAFALLELSWSQRSLWLIAEEDARLVDRRDEGTVIGELKKAQAAKIDHCEDTKHYIEPLIDAGNGKIGRLSPCGKVRFEVRETGLLSWPQFLWCGGL